MWRDIGLGALYLAGLIFLASAGFGLALVVAAYGDRLRRWPRLPLPLLRALTWRKRKRSTYCPVLTDAAQVSFSEEQEAALAMLDKELR